MAYTHDSDVTISGDVGIGSETIDQLGWGTSDGKQLTVYSGTTDKPAVLNLVSENRDTDGSIGALLFGQKTGGSYYSKVSGERDGSDTSFGLSFVTAYDSGIHERMRIKADGNVGIGETNPTSKLAIVGSHASQNSLHSQSAGSGRSGYFIGGPNTGASNGVYIQSGSNSSDWGLNIYNRANTAAQFIVRGDGNVGIGTSSPNALLHINKAASGVMPAMHLERTGAMNHYIGYDTDNKLVIGENVDMVSTVRMAIDTNGRVGIGTNNPASYLHVYTDSTDAYTPTNYNDYSLLTLQHPNADTYYSGIRFTNSAGNYEKFIGSVQTSGNTADIVFQGHDRGAGAYKEYMRIQEDGRVGIGTESPAALMHTYSSSNTAAKFESTDANCNIIITDSGGSGINIKAVGDVATISTGDTMAMTIDASQNVGIGDSSPSYKLEVAGTFYASGSSQAFKKNVTDLAVDSSAIYNLNPVSYNYKKDYENFGYDLAEGKQFGLISEEVAEAVPELAIMKDGEPKNVDYQKLSVLLLAEMQKMNKRIKDLECHI